MNTFTKVAVAAVAVIAIGAVGLTFLNPNQGGVGGAPSAAPSPTAEPAATPTPSPDAPALTGQYTSERNGFSISYPETWSTRPATTAWTSGTVDYFNDGADLLQPGNPGTPFVALAAQQLGDRTSAEWEADVWQMLIADDPGVAECRSTATPITIDGALGVRGCDTVLVTDGGHGYVVMLWIASETPAAAVADDRALFESMLATMKLDPEAAIDSAPDAPALTGQYNSERNGFSISYPETWNTRPATALWTTGVVDWFNDGADILMPGNPGTPFVALASQQLGDRTPAAWEADTWQMLIADDAGTAECQAAAKPITIDGAVGSSSCDIALVTDGGRGYLVQLWIASETPPDEAASGRALFKDVLATMKLQPENAVDGP